MCGGPAWKREVVPDHKFDFVDVRDFTDNGFAMRMKYLWLYLIVLKDFLVYVSDIFTAVTMATASKTLSTAILSSCATDGCISVPFPITRWLFIGCIIFSFLLLAYESRKARKIVLSRDISYAFTNVMANNYYSLRSYDHFCFFAHISDSTTTKDDLILFVFFTFKSWKRVLLADGPRQAINALTLYAIYLSKKDTGKWYNIGKYFSTKNIPLSILTVTTFFTVLVFVGSLLLLITAGVIYVPLICYIRGNLKEYVCHKVDKRISQIIKRRNKERLAKAAELAKKEAMGDYSHLMNKKGELVAKPLPQPTLPNLSVDDDMSGPPSSKYTQDTYYADYPPMPPYEQPYGHYPNASQGTFASDAYQQQGVYGYDNESMMHLASGAAPFSNQPTPQNYYIADPHDVYSGINASDRQSPAPSYRQPQAAADPSAGLAYDREYPDAVYNPQQRQQGGNYGYP